MSDNKVDVRVTNTNYQQIFNHFADNHNLALLEEEMNDIVNVIIKNISMDIPLMNMLRDRCHKQAKEKGFWNNPVEFGTNIALCHSELSEALEAHREGKIINEDDIESYYNDKANGNFEVRIKDSVQDELGDCVIRIADIFGYYGWNLDFAVSEKLDYNLTREYKHGKEY